MTIVDDLSMDSNRVGLTPEPLNRELSGRLRTQPCPYCNRKFRSRQDLRNHVRRMRRTPAAHGLDGQAIRKSWLDDVLKEQP